MDHLDAVGIFGPAPAVPDTVPDTVPYVGRCMVCPHPHEVTVQPPAREDDAR